MIYLFNLYLYEMLNYFLKELNLVLFLVENWFGIDDCGCDVFVWLLYGFCVLVLFGLVFMVFGVLVGMLMGVLMGFFGGCFDMVL